MTTKTLRTRKEIPVLANGRLMLLLAGWCLLGTAAAAQTPASRFEVAAFAGGRALLTFSAAPLLTMTEIPFTLDLRDGDGKPLPAAAVSVSLDMPAMPMPRNTPRVEWRDGAWRGTAVFTMAGGWQAHVLVRQPGGQEERLTFDIAEVLIR